MSKKKPRPSPLGEILENLLRQPGLSHRFREQKILDSWKRVVGEGIAEHTDPIRIQNQILQVRVDNSVWLQQLQFMKGMILKKIREETDAENVKDLRFFIGEMGREEEKERKDAPKEISPQEGIELTEMEKAKIRNEVSKISDPEMRRIFESVFSRGMAVHKAILKRQQ